MSARGMMWARQQKTGNPTTKAILLMLGEMSDDTGVTFRGQEFLCDVLEMSRSTMSRGLKALEDAGLIWREARFWDDSHKRRTDVICLPVVNKSHVSDCDMDPETHVSDCADPCVNLTETHVSDRHIKITKTFITTSETTNSADASLDAGKLPKPVVAQETPDPSPERFIAKVLYDQTRGALNFMAMAGIAKWALAGWPGLPVEQVGRTMLSIHANGQAVTKARVQLALDGIKQPGRPSIMQETVAERHRRENAELERMIAERSNPAMALET